MKTYFFGSKKSGKDLLSKIPKENLAGFEIDEKSPNWQEINRADCIWFFGTKETFQKIYRKLLLSSKSLIINLAKQDLPSDLPERLKEKNIKCIYGPRLCLGMNLLTPFIESLNKGQLFWNNSETQVHDIAASDEPSRPGSLAKEWGHQVNPEAKILIDRISNNPGQTHISLSSENESIQISHKILNRDAYIQGALWATYKVLFSNNQIPTFSRFEDLFWQMEVNKSMISSINLTAEA